MKKKPLYFAFISGFLLAFLLVGWHLYSLIPANDHIAYFSVRKHGEGYGLMYGGEIISGIHIFEIVCKQNKPFTAVISLKHIPVENEKEDGDMERAGYVVVNPIVGIDEIVNLPAIFPEQPAVYSRKDRMWVARFFIHAFPDGSLAVHDTIFGPGFNSKESIVPFEPPQQNILWGVSTCRFASYCETNFRNHYSFPVAMVYGWEGERHQHLALLRFILFVAARSLSED